MSGSKGSEYPAFSISLVTLLAIVVIGIFALFSLFLGFQQYGAGNMDQAYYYMIIGVAGFAAMGFMFFRTRAMVQNKLEVPKVEVLTTLECQNCDEKVVREFKRGDYVFKDEAPCTKCEGRMVITRVHRRKKTEKEREKERLGG